MAALATLEQQEVERFAREFEAPFYQGDVTTMTSYYTEDAQLMVEGQEIIQGREAIERLQKFFSRRITMIWEIDSTHSQVSFAIRVMSVTTMRGRFNKVRGQLHIDEQNPGNSWVEAEVDAASITTHNRLRDTNLCSNAFFALKKYPTISLRSNRVEHIGGSIYKVKGNLTLLGRTKPIIFDVEYSGQSAGFNARADLTAKTTIGCHDFGLGMIIQAAAETATVEIALVAVQKAVKVPETTVKVG